MSTTVGQAKSDELLNDVFSGYDAAGGVDLASVATVGIDTEHIVSSGTFTLAGGEVTVNTDGTYEVHMTATVHNALGTARTQVQMWLEVNNVEVPGTRMMAYCRQLNHGASGTAQVYLSLSDGDMVRLRAQRTAGTGTVETFAGGSRLTLRRL